MPNAWTTLSVVDGRWKTTYTADQASSTPVSLILNTENKFLDKNILIQASIGAGSLSAGAGSTGLTNHGATGLLGSSSNTAPSSGHYLEITGSGSVSVGTGGWIAQNTSQSSNTKTLYYPITSAVFNDDGNGIYCTTSGYVAANDSTPIGTINTVTPTTSYANTGLSTYFDSVSSPSSSSDYNVSITPRYSNSAGYVTAHTNTNNGGIGYWAIKTTSVTQGVTTVTGSAGSYTVTRGTASWGTGWISSNSISAATFTNTPATGKTANNYVDISDTSAAPILLTGDYLYITKGYTDDIKISLSKLVPDADQITGGKTFASANYILSGYAAWDEAGEQITGTIPTISLPTTTDSSAGTNYTNEATLNVSTSNRYINIPTGYNPTSGYYLVRAVYLSTSLTESTKANNIKSGVVVKVGDSNNNGRLVNITGTFTSSSTSTATNGVAAAGHILSGYGAWVNGAEVIGTIPTKTSSNLSISGATFTAPAGYYATAATKTMSSTVVTLDFNNTGLSTYFDTLSNSTNSTMSITPKYTNTPEGYLAEHTTAVTGTVKYYKIKIATFTGNGGNVALNYDTSSNLSIYRSASSTAGITISDSAPAANSGKVYIKVTGSGQVKTSSAGWWENNTDTGATGSKVRYIALDLYDGTATVP